MKGYKCIKLAIFFITCLLLSSLSLDANAIVYNTSNYKSITAASVIFRNGGSVPFTMNSSTGGAYANITGFNNSSGFYYLAIAFSGTIPARSLLVVNVETRFSNSYPQMGWTTRSGAYSLISASYGDYGSESLVFYVDQDITGEIDLFPTVQDSGQTTQLFMTISPISYTTLSFEPTWDQLNEISAKLTTSNGNLQIIRGKLDDIATLLEEQNDAQEQQQQQDQEDRDNLETQQEETNEQANDTSSDVQGATTNIIGVISGFSDALNNIQTGNCTLPTISAYGFSLGNINLCTYSPPSWVQGAVSIVVSFITLRLAIAVFYRIMGALDGVLGGKR